ncbi:hypothetical protein E4U43_008011 [Claviceps pusilla]|uniref:Uncharacterized protein n=1 Tax=Claviceps pusilla TaxID=123648 RepID=A0A9P7T160_9HYPO|nr:hypothetical protein E4U43_008011 [Claviceps pusilla]
MLATHRDQENLVHSHQQAAIKQQPKSPGARHPKTPGNHGRNDENAPNTVMGKAGLASGARLGGTGKLAMGKATGGPHSAITPMENRSRAPLGNKTTNAKAKNAQNGGIKDAVRDIERTQVKKTSSRKLKKQPASLQPVNFNIQSDISDGPEADLPKPEYAPPRPTPLPYESDVLPPGGLTFNGLKRENLFKGYYEHFHNPVDENGISRMEKKFNDEMAALMRRAEERNQQEIGAFVWSPEDLADNMTSNLCEAKRDSASIARSGSSASHRQAPTVHARRAASALAVHSDKQTRNALRPVPVTGQVTKRPLSAIITGTRTANPVVTRPTTSGNTTGEVASRTTLGYSKGRSASSIVHMRSASHAVKQQLPLRPAPPTQTASNLTITPARLRETVSGTTEQSRPQFMSIFDDADDEDLPPVRGPLFPSDDEDEEEFEFKLTI